MTGESDRHQGVKSHLSINWHSRETGENTSLTAVLKSNWQHNKTPNWPVFTFTLPKAELSCPAQQNWGSAARTWSFGGPASSRISPPLFLGCQLFLGCHRFGQGGESAEARRGQADFRNAESQNGLGWRGP